MMTPKKTDGPITVHITFAPELLKKIDKHAESEDRTRVNMIQVLVKRGLETTEAGER